VKKNRISISIVVYNNSKTELTKFFKLLGKIKKINFKIFVIDNGKDFLFKIPNKINYVYTKGKNVGFASGHNKIINKIRSDYHIICNTDLSFNPNIFNQIIKFMDNNKSCHLMGPKIIDKNYKYFGNQKLLPSLKDIFMRKFFKKKYLKNINILEKKFFDLKKPIEALNLSGCFMVFRTKTFLKLNGFDERYFLYFDDLDISRRMLKKKLKLIYNPNILIKHTARSDHRKNLKVMIISLISCFKYFYKWGFFSNNLRSYNKRFLKSLNL
jgi:GT2 family glycosyltransferase